MKVNLPDVTRGHFPRLGFEIMKSCAAEVEQILQHGDFHYLIENMYSEQTA